MDTEDDDPPTGLDHSYEQQRRLEEPSFRRQANLSPEGQVELRGDFCPWWNTFSPRRGIQNGYNSANYYPCNGLAYNQEKLVEYEPKHQWTSHIHAKPNIHYAGIEDKETKYRYKILYYHHNFCFLSYHCNLVDLSTKCSLSHLRAFSYAQKMRGCTQIIYLNCHAVQTVRDIAEHHLHISANFVFKMQHSEHKFWYQICY